MDPIDRFLQSLKEEKQIDGKINFVTKEDIDKVTKSIRDIVDVSITLATKEEIENRRNIDTCFEALSQLQLRQCLKDTVENKIYSEFILPEEIHCKCSLDEELDFSEETYKNEILLAKTVE